MADGRLAPRRLLDLTDCRYLTCVSGIGRFSFLKLTTESCAASCSAAARKRLGGRRLRLADDRSACRCRRRCGSARRSECGRGTARPCRGASASPPPLPKMSLSVLAGRADEVAHVLDQPERRDVQLLVHPDRAAGVGQRHALRRRHDDRAGDRHGLAQAERHVAGARRQIDDQVVEVVPRHFAEELLDDAVQHRPAPDDRRVVAASGTPSRRAGCRTAPPGRSSCRRSSSWVWMPSMIGTFGP